MTETANTVVIAGRMGVTDKLDVGVTLPIVTVKVGGSTSLLNGNGDILTFASGSDRPRDSATSPGSSSTASIRSAPASRTRAGWR